MTKKSENIPKERHLDDSSDRHHGEFKKRRKPVQDFPPDCRITETERRVFKNSRNADSNLGKMTNFHGKDKLMMKKSENIPKKRHLDDPSDRHHGEFMKRRIPVQDSQDFPPDSRITETERRVFKNSRNADSNRGKMTNFHGKDMLMGTDQSLEKEVARNKPPFGLRPPDGKVKFLDPRSLKEGHPQQPKVTTTTTWRKNSGNVDSNLGKMTSHGKSQPLKHKEDKELGRNSSYLGERRNRKPEVTFKNIDNVESNLTRKERVKREKIKEALIMFDEENEKLYQINKSKPKGEKIAGWRVPMQAAQTVERRLKLMDLQKKIGPICGVEIGNKFKYRAQLKMIGLHCQIHSGIDYIKIGKKNGKKNVAISIVDSHRYSNVSKFPDKLIYCGQGGFGFMGTEEPNKDQELLRGNLALWNSMDEGTSVRVIRKVQGDHRKSEVYVYDGLYIVKKCTQTKEEGKTVFKFELHREPEQPELLRMIRGSR